jgi:hypothetical protein
MLQPINILYLVANDCFTCIYHETVYINHKCIAFDKDKTIVCTDFDNIALISKEHKGQYHHAINGNSTIDVHNEVKKSSVQNFRYW